mmetsp:Transcript_33373/g.95777  ORF Transcript_33373/g.95777 Transcript_33373/m.95777 type:complete len:402 (+) Transcript_33373:1823-3028(+)
MPNKVTFVALPMRRRTRRPSGGLEHNHKSPLGEVHEDLGPGARFLHGDAAAAPAEDIGPHEGLRVGGVDYGPHQCDPRLLEQAHGVRPGGRLAEAVRVLRATVDELEEIVIALHHLGILAGAILLGVSKKPEQGRARVLFFLLRILLSGAVLATGILRRPPLIRRCCGRGCVAPGAAVTVLRLFHWPPAWPRRRVTRLPSRGGRAGGRRQRGQLWLVALVGFLALGAHGIALFRLLNVHLLGFDLFRFFSRLLLFRLLLFRRRLRLVIPGLSRRSAGGCPFAGRSRIRARSRIACIFGLGLRPVDDSHAAGRRQHGHIGDVVGLSERVVDRAARRSFCAAVLGCLSRRRWRGGCCRRRDLRSLGGVRRKTICRNVAAAPRLATLLQRARRLVALSLAAAKR